MPHELVTRDQQVTMLSRVLDGTTFDNQDGRYPTWYGGHMQNLLAKGMITNTEPTLIEKRIYPLLMFLRRERDK